MQPKASQCVSRHVDEYLSQHIINELTNDLLPRANRMVLATKHHAAFSHFACGLVCRVLARPEEAIAQYRQSLSNSPDSLDTLLEVKCLGESGRFAEALDYARHATKVEPSSHEAWGNLAMTLIQVGDERGAREALEKALKLAPNDALNMQTKALFDERFRGR